LVVFTIVSAFILLATIALVGNTQVLFVNSDRADAAALIAAQAGATAIDPGQLYNDKIELDPNAAQTRCESAGDAQAAVLHTHCSADPTTGLVTATVQERVQMPIPLWSSFETVSATRTARPAYGGTTGGFSNA
jgi:hypothetical protein